MTPSKSSSRRAATAATTAVVGGQKQQDGQDDRHGQLVRSLSLLDPILQFLTRATGQSLVPLSSLLKCLPTNKIPIEDIITLDRSGIIQVQKNDNDDDDDDDEHEVVAGDDHQETKEEESKYKKLRIQWQQLSSTIPKEQQLQKESTKTDKSEGDRIMHSVSVSKTMMMMIGFPSPDGKQRLSGSTKTAAKRRMQALTRWIKGNTTKDKKKKKTKQSNSSIRNQLTNEENINDKQVEEGNDAKAKNYASKINESHGDVCREAGSAKSRSCISNQEEMEGRKVLQDLLGLKSKTATGKKGDRISIENGTSVVQIPKSILPDQASYAGSSPGKRVEYEEDLSPLKKKIDECLWKSSLLKDQKLYRHQATAIRSALDGTHTLVCTGTGSGKSLCFLIPVLQAAIRGEKSLLLFPTKALAQDQLTKLQSWLQDEETKSNLSSSNDENELLYKQIRPATLDGDTVHSDRQNVCAFANIILTNPDMLHSTMLPQWKHVYRPLFESLRYVVLDEAHTYQGIFGAHVSMILSRLYRICCLQTNPKIARNTKKTKKTNSLIFLGCSATLAHPEHHFRLLFNIPETMHDVSIVKDDASPRAAKYFWVWNPPLIDTKSGKSLERVQFRNKRDKHEIIQARYGAVGRQDKLGGEGKSQQHQDKQQTTAKEKKGMVPISDETNPALSNQETAAASSSSASVTAIDSTATDTGTPSAFLDGSENSDSSSCLIKRRHAADETALLLARAVIMGVRCIAFCKTRGLVEWVYERTMSALQMTKETSHLTNQVESYRGGYTKAQRRCIEERLFNNEILGVVGTSALELGVDIGGIDLTLHCGFPASHESLLQQAGRAGRGVLASHKPSVAVCVCFNSPIDQHLWRFPKSLLSRGLTCPLSLPIQAGLVQGHLTCAGQEFPLSGPTNVLSVASADCQVSDGLMNDEDLFGSKEIYHEALDALISRSTVIKETVETRQGPIDIFKTHPALKNPSTEVSIRSCEPVSYEIVDVSHPSQAGRTDGIHGDDAILDTIPYSRVFYHAFPGAIITHRGRRYKIMSMTRPPPFGKAYGSVTLCAFARPCTHRYYTRPLSNLRITVVKQLDRVDLLTPSVSKGNDSMPNDAIPELEEPTRPSAVAATTTATHSDIPASPYDNDDPSMGSFAGYGVVNVKRNVHGYKKISMVTRDELSRSELSLPDMEYDTFGFWLDCDAEKIVNKLMTSYAFGCGVHALSHAIVAVAPMFVPCVMADIQCDHSVYGPPTRVTIFDSRAGGSGVCAELWKQVFVVNNGGGGSNDDDDDVDDGRVGIIEAALDLLQDCPSCSIDKGYDGGCPACLQAGECIKFNDYLSKSNGYIIGNHLLRRLKQTSRFKETTSSDAVASAKPVADSSGDMSDDDGDNHKNNTNDIFVGRDTKVTSPDSNKKRKNSQVTFSSPSDASFNGNKKRVGKKSKMDAITTTTTTPLRHGTVVVGRPSWPTDTSSPPSSNSNNNNTEDGNNDGNDYSRVETDNA